MRTYKYIGLFESSEGHTYHTEVSCNGTIQALFLLTADAIRSGKHYQLKTITDEDGRVTKVGSILGVGKLLN